MIGASWERIKTEKSALATRALGLATAGALMLLASGGAFAQASQFIATLTGGASVPTIVSSGAGAFRASVSGSTLNYTLLLLSPGTDGEVTMAHVHVAQPYSTGGIAVWLCTSPSAPLSAPAGTPACPTRAGSVSGSLTAADVQAIAAQGLTAGDLGALLSLMRAGDTYVNVHTTTIGSGEIRGQIQPAQ